METVKFERESNIELLRIVLMIMIVGIHYFLHGQALNKLNIGNVNYYIANILQGFFIISVNCFIIMSGYFQIKFKIEKLFKLELQVLFYSIIIFFIFTAGGLVNINLSEIKMTITPVLSSRWWFVTIYISLFIISPYLNLLIDKLDKRQYTKLLIILFFIFSLFPTINLSLVDVNKGQSLYSFLFLYMIGAYIKRFLNDCKIKKKYLFMIYMTCILSVFIGNLSMTILLKKNVYTFFNYQNPIVVIGAITFFMYFNSMKIKSKTINNISRLVFGVYLIHDHMYVRNYIYTNILHTNDFWMSKIFIVHAILSIISVFSICIVIEYARIKIFEKFETILLEFIYKLLNKKAVKKIKKIFIQFGI